MAHTEHLGLDVPSAINLVPDDLPNVYVRSTRDKYPSHTSLLQRLIQRFLSTTPDSARRDRRPYSPT